jgi:hypothetical protein
MSRYPFLVFVLFLSGCSFETMRSSGSVTMANVAAGAAQHYADQEDLPVNERPLVQPGCCPLHGGVAVDSSGKAQCNAFGQRLCTDGTPAAGCGCPSLK